MSDSRESLIGGKRSVIPHSTQLYRLTITLILGFISGYYFSYLYFTFCRSDESNYLKPLKDDGFWDSNVYSMEAETQLSPKRQPRIFCMIFTRPATHDSQAQQCKDTWAKRCDKTIFFTTREASVNNSLGAIPLNVSDNRDELWTKAKIAFNYTYYNHLQDGDWFYKADDDAYAIVENLRKLVEDYDINTPKALGCLFKPMDPELNVTYFSGGPGYIMNKAAFTKFIKFGLETNEYLESCPKSSLPSEDVFVGQCLHSIGVNLINAVDSLGRSYFSVFTPEAMVNNKTLPAWYKTYVQRPPIQGADCYPEYVAAFHYVQPGMMQLYDYYTYGLKVYQT